MAPLRSTALAGCVLLSARYISSTFAVGTSVKVPPRDPVAGSLRGSAKAAPAEGSATLCGAAAVLTVGVAAAAARSARRASKAQCNAFTSSFSSGSSGFIGQNVGSSYIAETIAAGPSQEEDYSSRSGVAGLGMKAQVWYIQNNGFDGKSGGKIYDWKRRESRRRGEELFRHDVDSFELTLDNIIGAPGSKKKRIVRGRGKYGSHGRTCGFGNGGAKKRGRRTINPAFEGGHVPLHIRTPKLSQEDLDSMRRDPYTPITLADLNMCDDGDEVDYMDLFVRGFPVKRQFKFDKFKVKGEDTDEFTTKNLTVYAHAFEPPAREKIEALGGKCVRLHEWAGIPLE